MGKRYPRAPLPKPRKVSSRGRLVRHAENGAIIETIDIGDRHIELHATKGIRNYRA